MRTDRRRWPLWMLLALFACPWLTGGGLYAAGWRPAEEVSRGRLAPLAALAPASGRWQLVWWSSSPCHAACRSAGETIGQVRRALGVDAPRLDGGTWIGRGAPVHGDGLYLVDPAGNLVLVYDPGTVAGEIRRDLGRLMRYTWLG